MHDWLERVDNVVEVQLAHPYGVRAIASAQVKTDRIDARMLGRLLRAGLIPRAHIPGRETRQPREAVRPWVRIGSRGSYVTICGSGHVEKAD